MTTQKTNSKISTGMAYVFSGKDRSELNVFMQHGLVAMGYSSNDANRICKCVIAHCNDERKLSRIYNDLKNEYNDYLEVYEDVKSILGKFESSKSKNKSKNKRESQVRSFFAKHFTKKVTFVKNDSHFSRYYEGICILFKTGLRISEFCGLTLADIDMKERTINVNHQLQRSSRMEYLIEDTKTNAGARVLPMTDEVYECFEAIIQNRPRPKKEPMIAGKTGFLYLDKNGMPMVALHWEKYFQHIVEKYNKIYRVQMPKVTPHVCRHTYCSNCARAGMNPKTLQYLMGHSDIGVTLNVYTNLGFDDAKDEMIRLEELEAAKKEVEKVTGKKPISQKIFKAI